jgi:hypothetical protein
MTSPEQFETTRRNAALRIGPCSEARKASRNEDLGSMRCHAEDKSQGNPEKLGSFRKNDKMPRIGGENHNRKWHGLWNAYRHASQLPTPRAATLEGRNLR